MNYSTIETIDYKAEYNEYLQRSPKDYLLSRIEQLNSDEIKNILDLK